MSKLTRVEQMCLLWVREAWQYLEQRDFAGPDYWNILARLQQLDRMIRNKQNGCPTMMHDVNNEICLCDRKGGLE